MIGPVSKQIELMVCADSKINFDCAVHLARDLDATDLFPARTVIRLSLETENPITSPISAEEIKEGMRIFKQMKQEAMQSTMRGQ